MRPARLIAFSAAMLTAGAPAFGGIFEEIYRGLDLLATPSDGPLFNTGDGTRVNGSRSGRLRIMPNQAGRGYQLEFDRTFGPDTRGRPEVFDAGPYELQLNGGIQSTAAVTTRFLPTFNANTIIANLTYSVRGKSGLQDVDFSGTLAGTTNFEINALGFYSLTSNINNTNAQLTLDGVVQNEEDTDFDIGPISVSGNIFLDGLGALAQSFGVDASDAVHEITPDSPIDVISGSIEEQLRQAAKASNIELDPQFDFSEMLADVMFDPNAQLVADATANREPAPPNNAPIPEPATALLLAGAGMMALRRR
ncbi:MAG: PEP-CTERM sorting domain-containing protein [Phycisphaerales bacterium]|nr:PEP-CTERM sorting domain-containing protein [Phycisphaerales bacterium]